jgi:hypothetical protein
VERYCPLVKGKLQYAEGTSNFRDIGIGRIDGSKPMAFKTFFSQQARKPSGWFGRWIMSGIFDFGNARLNRLVYDILSPAT